MYMYNNCNCNSNYSKCEPRCEKRCEPKCSNDYINCKTPSYADYLKENECKHCDAGKSKESILCYQAWVSKCEAKLFCEAATRLSYELCKANCFWEVKQIIDSISCLFCSSATKEKAMAQVIESINCKKCCDCDCDCDC